MTKPPLYRHIGGIHFIAIGRLRIQLSWARKRPTVADLHELAMRKAGPHCSWPKQTIVAFLHSDGVIREQPETVLAEPSVQRKLPHTNAYTWPPGVAHAMEKDHA